MNYSLINVVHSLSDWKPRGSVNCQSLLILLGSTVGWRLRPDWIWLTGLFVRFRSFRCDNDYISHMSTSLKAHIIPSCSFFISAGCKFILTCSRNYLLKENSNSNSASLHFTPHISIKGISGLVVMTRFNSRLKLFNPIILVPRI